MSLLLVLLASLCMGRVADKAAHPMVAMDRPATGASYRDPAFGGEVTRITAAASGEAIVPLYSTVQAWNADESLLLLYRVGVGHELYRGQPPYTRIGPLVTFAPTDIEDVLWDDQDPRLLRYPSNWNAHPWLIEHRLGGTVRVLRDFAGSPTFCPVGDWTRLLSLGADPQHHSRGGQKVIGLRCGALGFLYSITDDVVLLQAQIPAGYRTTFLPSPSGGWFTFDRFVWAIGDAYPIGSMGMDSPYEHGSFGQRYDHDVWNTVAFRGSPRGTLVSYDLASQQPTVIIGPSTGWPEPPSGTHISSIGAAGWAAVSVRGTATGIGALDDVILLANTETGEVCRIAHARTKGEDYWSEPHAVISPSGTRVLFGSDFGGPWVDTYVVDLRKPA